MSIEYRPIERGDSDGFERFRRANGRAFGYHPEEFIIEDHPWAKDLIEFERSLTAWDGANVVGTAGAHSFEMTAPGGTLPTAGVTWVGVQPTHRRRGVLTGMMRRQLDDVHERGEPLAALWASESIIYGRFGYGLASFEEEWRIEREHTAFRSLPADHGQIKMVLGPEAVESMPRVWDAVRAQRNGMMTRGAPNWLARVDSKKSFYALYHEDDEPRGYAVYEIENNWQDSLPRSTLKVQELMAVDAGAEAALWRFCFDIDLIGEIWAGRRPVDDPLVWMLADPRRLRRNVGDALWLRIIDVQKALTGRHYVHQGGLRFELRDSFCPWNEGVYDLEVGPGGASCKRANGSPDVVMSTADLGAFYLGGVRPSTLSDAGRIEENTPGALFKMDVLFAAAPAPWAAHHF